MLTDAFDRFVVRDDLSRLTTLIYLIAKLPSFVRDSVACLCAVLRRACGMYVQLLRALACSRQLNKMTMIKILQKKFIPAANIVVRYL